MDVIAEARRRVEAREGLRVIGTERSVEVLPSREEGFAVSLWVGDGAKPCIVRYDGWSERFEKPREALDAFSYGLFGDCRLRVSLLGARPVRWILEHRRDGRFTAERAQRSLLGWLPVGKSERILSNR